MGKVNLKVTEYKVSVHWEDDELIEDHENMKEVDKYNLECKSIQELPEKAKEIAQFNERQITYCEKDKNRNFILKRIIKSQ